MLGMFSRATRSLVFCYQHLAGGLGGPSGPSTTPQSPQKERADHRINLTYINAPMFRLDCMRACLLSLVLGREQSEYWA